MGHDNQTAQANIIFTEGILNYCGNNQLIVH
jgi:hypothetical protein